MADFDSKLPVRSLAVDNTTEIANSSGTTIDPATEGGNLASIKTDLDQLTFASTRLLTDGSGVTQPVSGTVTANIGTTNGLALDATLTGGTQKSKLVDSGGTNVATVSAGGALKVDGSAVTQPISAASLPLPTGAATETTLAAASAKLPATLGQKTMANSLAVVLASDQSSIPVTFTPASTVELPQYSTASAVAAAASSTQTYSPGSTVLLDGVEATASGQMKVEIQYGTTASETTKFVLFTSKGNLNASLKLPYPISITNTMSVKVIRTNMDNQAMDVYSTILVH